MLNKLPKFATNNEALLFIGLQSANPREFTRFRPLGQKNRQQKLNGPLLALRFLEKIGLQSANPREFMRISLLALDKLKKFNRAHLRAPKLRKSSYVYFEE